MKMVKAEKDMRIIDTVEYHNLKKGKIQDYRNVNG